ncbi:DUF4124 domain-containing protein [Massilia sp. TSP1-1-2]|uniref:DUF4124 domain-containing protein n=1 Tax=Massilia sp. TSP1-1-2 TaxID=2804649 RepID=UPI003CF15F82
MNNSNILRGLQLIAGGALLIVANLSHAQYAWIDAKGMKQFSDRPPPPGTPQKNILRGRNMATASGAAPAPATATATAPAAAAPAAATKVAPPSLAEREAEYRKRKTEQVESEKKAGLEAENAKAKAAACTSARQAKTQIDTGAPIREANAERSWLDDKQRAERKAAAEKSIGEFCG